MKKTIHNILAIITLREKQRIGLFIFLNTIINLLDVFSMVCLLFIIKFYTQPYPVSDKSLLARIFPNKDSLIPVLILMLLFAIKNIAGHSIYKAQARFVSNVAVRISRQNLSNYLLGPYSAYANIDSAVYVSKIIHQPTEFAQYILRSIQQIITELLLIAFSIVALMIYNAHLFIIVFLTMLPAVIILSWLTKRRLEKIKKNIKIVVEHSLQYLNEALKGFVESNIYDKNVFFVKRHEAAQKKVGAYVADIQTTQDIPARFFEVFAILGLFVLIVAIKYTSTIDNTDLVILGAFIAAAYKIIPSISKIINLSGQIRAYRYVIQGVNTDIPIREEKRAAGGKIELIGCKNISFSYAGLKVLENFSCNIKAGSFTGITGDSGSGKTTLLQLLLGFCKPQTGEILFNNQITDDTYRTTQWGSIAYVKQDPFILHDTVLNNIVLFENEYDIDRLNMLLHITGLEEVINRVPEGLQMPVMEGGKNLSGGQRKRVALARALYKDADIILLDEPFSELDEGSELKMLQHLKKLAEKGKMIVLISHSPNSFRLCDNVINIPTTTNQAAQ